MHFNNTSTSTTSNNNNNNNNNTNNNIITIIIIIITIIVIITIIIIIMIIIIMMMFSFCAVSPDESKHSAHYKKSDDTLQACRLGGKSRMMKLIMKTKYIKTFFNLFLHICFVT